MLDAREYRAYLQRQLQENGLPLLCLTMNIAGPIKRTPLVRFLFDAGVQAVMDLELPIKKQHIIDAATGCEAFFSIDAPAETIKTAVTALEDAFPAARLFDLDVLTPEGIKLSRKTPRRCLICGNPAADCASTRAHGLDALTEKTDALLCSFAADRLAELAKDALIKEVYTTPKPGLVDAHNCGAHDDMDLPMFVCSANALLPYFRKAVQLGLIGCTMQQLREAGLRGEASMYAATNDVNTHKGAVFSMGLLLYGMGRVLRIGGTTAKHAATLVSEDAEQMQQQSRTAPSTNGGYVLANYGALGARGEAMLGFPHAQFARERLIVHRKNGSHHAEALTLCDLMAVVDDTNLLHRGGPSGLAFVKAEAARISAIKNEDDQISALNKLDEVLISRHLSPGGCADLLALGLLLEQWERLSAHLLGS